MKIRGATKSKIERSALSLFVGKGIRQASIRDITRAAGITEGAFYRHFVSKDQLAESLFARHYADFSAELKGIAQGPGKFRERLSAMVEVFCRSFDENPTLYGYLLLSQHDELRKLEPAALSPHVVLRNALSNAIRNKEIPSINPVLGTALIMGVVLETAKFVIYRRLLKQKMMQLAPDLKEASLRVLRVQKS